jgi:hypothetical protein
MAAARGRALVAAIPGRRVAPLLLGGLFLWGSVAQVQGQAGPVEGVVVGDEELNVRAGPGLGQPIIGTLRPGMSLLIVEGPLPADGWTWCHHTGPTGEGWSVCEALRTARELGAIPGSGAGAAAPAAAGPAAAAPAGAAPVAAPPAAPPVTVRPPPSPPPQAPVRLPPPAGSETAAAPSAPAPVQQALPAAQQPTLTPIPAGAASGARPTITPIRVVSTPPPGLIPAAPSGGVPR